MKIRCTSAIGRFLFQTCTWARRVHRAEMRDIDGVLYCNDGDWVESRTALVENFDGTLEIIHWQPLIETSSRARTATVTV